MSRCVPVELSSLKRKPKEPPPATKALEQERDNDERRKKKKKKRKHREGDSGEEGEQMGKEEREKERRRRKEEKRRRKEESRLRKEQERAQLLPAQQSGGSTSQGAPVPGASKEGEKPEGERHDREKRRHENGRVSVSGLSNGSGSRGSPSAELRATQSSEDFSARALWTSAANVRGASTPMSKGQSTPAPSRQDRSTPSSRPAGEGGGEALVCLRLDEGTPVSGSMDRGTTLSGRTDRGTPLSGAESVPQSSSGQRRSRSDALQQTLSEGEVMSPRRPGGGGSDGEEGDRRRGERDKKAVVVDEEALRAELAVRSKSEARLLLLLRALGQAPADMTSSDPLLAPWGATESSLDWLAGRGAESSEAGEGREGEGGREKEGEQGAGLLLPVLGGAPALEKLSNAGSSAAEAAPSLSSGAAHNQWSELKYVPEFDIHLMPLLPPF